MAFSAEENAAIRETLLREARRCAVTLGLRKTSVEQLTEAAGISKGLFYKYFASKELLFFEVLEDIHSEVYQVAEQVLEEGKDLPPDERIANVLLTACSRLSEIGAMKFIEEDSAYLLRRIPAQVKAEHYHSDEVHIRDLLEESGLTPRGGDDPRSDPHGVASGADRRAVSAGARNADARRVRRAVSAGVNAACGFLSHKVRDIELKIKTGRNLPCPSKLPNFRKRK